MCPVIRMLSANQLQGALDQIRVLLLVSKAGLRGLSYAINRGARQNQAVRDFVRLSSREILYLLGNFFCLFGILYE